MAGNHKFYANESTIDKENRVNGPHFQGLYDEFNQTTGENTRFNGQMDRSDESYSRGHERRTNTYRIFTRKTKTNENVELSSNQAMNTYRVNDQALSYATEMHLTPLRIKCNPSLTDKNTAAKLVQALFKRIENAFRNKHKEYKKAIGFEYWWIDKNGELVGITKDILLYVYLCDVRNYPEQIDSAQITPLLPVRLPPQHAIVIKFVSNEYPFIELEEDLKNRYSTVYHIEEMNGTRRLHTRHIRMDIYDLKEYNKILNSGSISLEGMLCEVDEYLPAPRILICTKCNSPEHTKKACRLSFEKCRRCGEDRNVGEHKSCRIICHHCGENHQANDYKCPILTEFRRELIDQLRQNRERLPPHIQMFIPYDCRIQKHEKSLVNQATNGNKPSAHQFQYRNTPNEWPHLSKTTETNENEVQLSIFQNELDSYKKKYQQEIERLDNELHHYRNYIQKTCSMINSQIKTQKDMIESTQSIMNEITFDVNTNVMNVVCNIIQTISEIPSNDKMKDKLNKWQDEMKVQQKQQCGKHLAYINYIQNLNKLWIEQSKNLDESLKSISTFTCNE